MYLIYGNKSLPSRGISVILSIQRDIKKATNQKVETEVTKPVYYINSNLVKEIT